MDLKTKMIEEYGVWYFKGIIEPTSPNYDPVNLENNYLWKCWECKKGYSMKDIDKEFRRKTPFKFCCECVVKLKEEYGDE